MIYVYYKKFYYNIYINYLQIDFFYYKLSNIKYIYPRYTQNDNNNIFIFKIIIIQVIKVLDFSFYIHDLIYQYQILDD